MAHSTTATQRGRKARQAAIRRSADSLPSFDDMRTNLLQTIADASEHSETEGLAWYLAAHSIAAELASEHGVTVRQAAGVIAALSPQTGWAENVRLAGVAFADGVASGHYDDACQKANAIMAGGDPSDILGGRKVRSFFTNICSPTVAGAVTVDRHCVDMLAGERGYVNGRILERIGAYALCAAVVRSVARQLGMLPHECQAVAWVAWRQAHDVAYKYDLSDL